MRRGKWSVPVATGEENIKKLLRGKITKKKKQTWNPLHFSLKEKELRLSKTIKNNFFKKMAAGLCLMITCTKNNETMYVFTCIGAEK